ncbi:MAG: hypothetical protein ACR2IM_01540 [Sediminibacterium sp.]|jgi:hypothetical protein
MDRVKALVEKLHAQLHQNEDKGSLIITAQQILTELGGAVSAKPLPQNIYEESVISQVIETQVVENNVNPVMEHLEAVSDEVHELPIEQGSLVSSGGMVKHEIVNSIEKIETKEVKDQIVLEPIKDLRSAIGINDKFQFIQELFGGDERSFEEAIKTINAFKIFPEAQFYIKRELREKNHWEEEHHVVKQFDQLIKRRFS